MRGRLVGRRRCVAKVGSEEDRRRAAKRRTARRRGPPWSGVGPSVVGRASRGSRRSTLVGDGGLKSHKELLGSNTASKHKHRSSWPRTHLRPHQSKLGKMSFTPDEQLDLAFPPSLVPKDVHARVPSELHLRPLAADDYARGHLDVLAVLTSAPDVGAKAWETRFREMKEKLPDSYYPIVIVDRQSDRLVAVGTLFVEVKFLRGNARAGHIEDIAVDKSQQGKGLGKTIIAALTALSEEALGCYKVFLDCSEANTAFYEKCGYKYAGVQMSKYAPAP
ncbi:unnamed protein product [Parajaminaea phylloscopi]